MQDKSTKAKIHGPKQSQDPTVTGEAMSAFMQPCDQNKTGSGCGLDRKWAQLYPSPEKLTRGDATEDAPHSAC